MNSRLSPTSVSSFLLGRRSDWHLSAPWIRLPRLSLHWLGPVAMVLSSIVGWLAFAGTNGLNQASTFSMWVGSTSIVLMAWSFILALRLRFLERFWGGLDSMYRGHRWAGALSAVMMFLHTSIEPRTKGATLVAGAAKGVADSAEDLAETGELMIYGLIGLSILRFIPYRWWRWTHKLFGIPFAFASWHFYTASKPYENASAWGVWFAGFMLAGLAAWVARVFVRDTVGQGSKYTIVDVEQTRGLTRIELAPVGKPLQFRAGQFAFLRIGSSGMREPHPFSIASGPSKDNLEFYIRHLGDWTDRLGTEDILGASVAVEGPYGAFEPISSKHEASVWIAGGVGITPFLAALDELPDNADRQPTVLYACKSTTDDPLVDLLAEADEAGRIRLQLFPSGDRLSADRLSADRLTELFPDGMADHHVALCGPAGLVKDMAIAASKLGATSIETEDFDIRQGFGPDRSREIDQTIRNATSRRAETPAPA